MFSCTCFVVIEEEVSKDHKFDYHHIASYSFHYQWLKGYLSRCLDILIPHTLVLHTANLFSKWGLGIPGGP